MIYEHDAPRHFFPSGHVFASGNSSWRTSSASACSASNGPWTFTFATSELVGDEASSEGEGEPLCWETVEALSAGFSDDAISSCCDKTSPCEVSPIELIALGSLSSTGDKAALLSLLTSPCGDCAKMSRPGSAFPASTEVCSPCAGTLGAWPRSSWTTIAPRPAGSPPIVATGWEPERDFCGVARMAPLYCEYWVRSQPLAKDRRADAHVI